MQFITSRLRAFDSLLDSIECASRGLELSSKVHVWIFWYRLKYGRYPSGDEIHRARKDM